MSTRFVGGEVAPWKALSAAAREPRRADVAVAYIGQGGARRLPLPTGSRLVVDASEPRVKAGATCPAELLKLVERGVDVYSRANLHAKVFVFSRSAFVGSANVSSGSADRLAEALIRTTDPTVVRRAREFVVGMCDGVPLGPEALQSLQKLYRPPRVPGGGRSAGGLKRGRQVWFERYDTDEYPEGSEHFVTQLLKEARAKTIRRRDFELLETWYEGPPPYAEGDIVMMTEGVGETEMVSPPARVVHVRKRSDGRPRYTFTIVELPKTRRVSLDRMAAALGYGWKKRLQRRGRLKHQTANAMLAWWDERK